LIPSDDKVSVQNNFNVGELHPIRPQIEKRMFVNKQVIHQ
jgi:hypothetical protein